MDLVLRTPSADDTRTLAGAVARLAREGDVFLLVGEMGAGKTAFAQGFAAGLGVVERVTSPTFVLVHDYTARLRMHHVDVYRLEHLQEVLDLGLAELLDDAVTLIEWGDVVVPTLPRDFLEVHLEFADGDDDTRRITLRDLGPSWQPRLGELTDAVSHWLEG